MISSRIVAAFATACIFAAHTAQGAAPAAAAPAKTPKRYTIEQFMATTNYGGASFSADGKRILYHSNETGIFNVYSMPVTGGKAEALTKSTTDTTLAVSYFANDDRVLYTRDNGGDENNHVYVRELDGSEKDITPGEQLKDTFMNWAPDGNEFYVTTNEPNGIHVVAMSGEGSEAPRSWSDAFTPGDGVCSPRR